jgi:conjugative relaxase-like TrwC/TraI family protein
MLSIVSIKSASGAADYYAKDNYYTESQAQEASEWCGLGAEALGLEGKVDPKDFEAVLLGKLPNGEQIAAGGNGKRLGVDLTFSAPKSLSLMALVGGDTRLIEAHGQAVKAALNYAEARFAAAGQGKQGREVVPTGNIVVALFAHDTSRKQDPQVHTHAIIAHMTQRPDGAWRALKNDAFYRENKLIGAVYHNELRTRVAALGYTIQGGGKNGTFEIAGINRETVKAWSQRSAEIEAIAKRLGVSSPEAKGEIAARSRGGKEDSAPEALREQWQLLAMERGDDFAAMIAAPQEIKSERNLLQTIKAWGEALIDKVMPFWRHRPDPLVSDADRLRQAKDMGAAYAVASSVRHLGEREATFRTNDVLREALNFAEQKAGIAQIEARFGKLVAEGTLIVGLGRYADRATTPEMIATEKAIIAFAKAGVGKLGDGPDAITAHGHIEAAALNRLGFALSAEQLQAAAAILYGSNRVELVQGDSGTGKSTIFAAINAVPADQRPSLMMLTNQSGLARELERDSGIATKTLAYFLTKFESLASTSRAARVEDRTAHMGKILIVDEASMVSARQMHGLFKIAHKLGIERIALVGDQKQIPAIEAGRPFALLQSEMKTLTLTNNVRQLDPEMRAVVAKLGAGDVRGAFELMGTRIVESTDPGKSAAQGWLALDSKRREETAIYTAGHRLREDVLEALKEGQGADRKAITLPVFTNLNRTAEEMRHVHSYAPGMQLAVIKYYRSLGLERGSYTVTDVDHSKGRVLLSRATNDPTKRAQPLMIKPANLHVGATGLSLMMPKQVKLYEGDRLMATAKVQKHDVVNGDRFILKAIEGEGPNARLRLERADGKTHLLEKGDPLRERLDHAGALNMHRVQGQTTTHAITVLSEGDRMLNSQSLAYVLSSRAREGFTLYLDDKERVIQQIERNDGQAAHAVDVDGSLRTMHDRPTDTLASPSTTKAELPPLGIDDALKAKLAALQPPPDKTNTLPVPQKQLGLEL